uniref:Uncharacterized protein n=1 Tax=Arundo donax TaxID=35708 RepID=A0A0A9DN63_ARUDO
MESTNASNEAKISSPLVTRLLVLLPSSSSPGSAAA